MEKAKIIRLEPTRKEINCLFNPNEYTFSKRNSWSKGERKGKNVPELEFGGGDSMTLKMQLFFDTSYEGKDVSKITNEIWQLMNINSGLRDMTSTVGRPPMVQFQWGEAWSFQAVITEISQKFTLFLDDGTPVRATLDVTFLQAKEAGVYPGQNPTTIGQPGYRYRMVHEGDTIDWISFDEYGDSAMWRFIADTNNLDNPHTLRVGQVLAIAPPP